jgi:hypothetical protein
MKFHTNSIQGVNIFPIKNKLPQNVDTSVTIDF